MDSNDKIIEQIKKQGMLPLFYHDDKETCLSVTAALYAAGIRIIEFTNRGKKAMENFEALVAAKNAGMKDLILAVGTIKTAEQASKFIQAGAGFLVSPVFDADIADLAYLNKVLWIPGCMTPTEIHVAENAGCKLVKLFPGNILGTGFVTAIRDLFPQMNLMPTGGVEMEEENLREWFNAGVCAVGMGSKLLSKTMLANKEYGKITESTAKALSIISGIKR